VIRFLFATVMVLVFQSGFAQCKSLKTLKAEFMEIIRPYDFEGISGGTLMAGKTRSISITVFSKVKYRLNFRTDGFDAPAIIRVLSINRQILWTNEKDPGNLLYEFIPQKSDRYFVEFSAPESSNDDSRGCVTVVLSSRPY